MGASSGCEKVYIKTGTSGHLWGISGDQLGQEKKAERRSPSFLTIPIPSTFKERELSKDKWKVKRRRKFLSIGAEERDRRGLGRSRSLLMGRGVTKRTSLCDRAHCFPGEVVGCTMSIPSPGIPCSH